jgi:N-acetylmuramoyl-L-alanine amidase
VLLSLAIATAPKFAKAADTSCDRAHFRIVIDVGHTATNYGATSASGLPEFRFNLDLAEIVLWHLQHANFSQAEISVRQGSENLFGRARALNAANPSVVLSLHHDDVQNRYLKKWIVNGRTQHYTDSFFGYSIFVSERNIDFAASSKFATLIGQELRAQGYPFTMHHHENIPGENRPVLDSEVGVFRYDNLVVLHQVQAPAVLLEAAVITNRDDEERAQDSQYRHGIAEAVVAAVEKYCVWAKASSHANKSPVGP